MPKAKHLEAGLEQPKRAGDGELRQSLLRRDYVDVICYGTKGLPISTMDAMTAGPAGEDLLITQGHDLDNIEQNFSSIHYREPMLLARNTGKGFVDVSAQSGDVFQQAWVARGMAVGDIFNDGTAHIIRSRADNSSHGLELKLVGIPATAMR